MTERIRIGTRGSKLALWQAEWVANRLREERPGLDVALVIVKTVGDTVLDRPLAALGVKGSFTKELDRALLDGEVDIVVNSLKDMPTELEDGTLLAAIPERADARDVFIAKDAGSLADLPPNAVVGTGSLRRRAQLRALRPDVETVDLRGNIDTRIRKLRESNTLAGIILAAAGVERLSLSNEVTCMLEYEDWLPAPGQGALAVVVREGDDVAFSVAALLDHVATRVCVTAERAMLARLEGGCHVPVGAHARIEADNLFLDGLVAEPNGACVVRLQSMGAPEAAHKVGAVLAERLLAKGGDRILAACERRM